MNADGQHREPKRVHDEEASSKQPIHSGVPHSVFTMNQKRAIIFTASVASFFSPLSANIYFPALNTLAKDLHVSISQINLTITTYLIFQGLAPTFIGQFSDSAGRRPAYIICFTIYIAANIGLALQNNYPALLVLRCLQSSGSSGTVALSTAVAADIVTSAERGSYVGFASIGAILGPSLSPVIGGLFSEYQSWRWIFWFLVIFAAVFFVLLLIFYPETCREVVGNGSITPPNLNQSLYAYIKQRKHASATPEGNNPSHRSHLRFPNPLATLGIVVYKDAALLLICIALLFSCYYAIATTIPPQFSAIYGFNDIHLGLVFLPVGGGSLISAFTTGKILDWNFRRHARRLGIPVEKNRQTDLSIFPIERARLEVSLPLLYTGALGCIGYGWAIHFQTHVAGPCCLLFLIGYSLVAGFTTISVLLVDMFRDRPATATAANNLVRCLLGAGASAVVNPLIECIGVGWTCTAAAMLWIIFTPPLWVLMKRGPEWRRERREKMAKKKDRKAGK